MTDGKPLLAGLTGGMGSGKSTVLKLLAGSGAETVSADLLAREAVAPGSEGLAEVIEVFGKEFIAPDGTLDRRAMARLIFSDQGTRRTLEGIIHPLVLREEEAVIADWEGRGRPAPLIVESPLLFEVGRRGRYELVILVTCPRDIRLARLEAAGVETSDAEARMAAQWPEARTVRMAGYVVDNSGDLAHARSQVEALLPLLQGR
jgi:dephospho-CoA kinase